MGVDRRGRHQALLLGLLDASRDDAVHLVDHRRHLGVSTILGHLGQVDRDDEHVTLQGRALDLLEAVDRRHDRAVIVLLQYARLAEIELLSLGRRVLLGHFPSRVCLPDWTQI